MKEFKVFYKFDHIIDIVGHCIDVGEDMVKVNDVSTKQVEPLGLWKLWNEFVAIEEG